MSTPFTYKITFNKTGYFYIGSCYKKGAHPFQLGNIYFSSSNTVKNLLKIDNNVTYKIISTYTDIESAILDEKRLIEENFNDPLNINLHRGTGSLNLAKYYILLQAGIIQHPIKGKHRITNGTIIKFSTEIPTGFIICSSKSVKDKKCYNNGKRDKYFSIEDNIPDEYIFGSIHKKHNKDKRWITDGLKNLCTGKNDIIPIGFYPGHTQYHKYQKLTYYNNGIKNIRIQEINKIPDGFVIGRLQNHGDFKKNSEKKYWINDGIRQKLIPVSESCPNGFTLGRPLRSTQLT